MLDRWLNCNLVVRIRGGVAMTQAKTRPRWKANGIPVSNPIPDASRSAAPDNDHGTRRITVPVMFRGGVWEDEQKVYYQFDLPGFSHDSLEASIEEGVLHIRGERKMPEGRGKCRHDERYYGRFERAIQLPELINFDSIDACYSDGVLQLTFAKRPESMPTKIAIRHGSSENADVQQ